MTLLNTFSFADSMFICLNQICGYTDLCHEAEQLRKEPYSSDNASHENRLMQVTDCKFLFLVIVIKIHKKKLSAKRMNGSVLWL